MSESLLKSVEERRSFYAIGKDTILSDDEIIALVRHSVQYAPSAFNSQSARVLVLLGAEHDKLWNYTNDILKRIVPTANFPATAAKIESFHKGYGTILYFEEQTTVKELQEKFPLYKENFPVWSQQSSGMLQYIIWTRLETEGYGASLQHYNPLIDQAVQQAWNVPTSWKLIAQMPFGKPLAKPDPKTFLPLDARIIVSK